MACCRQCEGSQRAQGTQARALGWGMIAADPGAGTDPFYRAASVENVVSDACPSRAGAWPRGDTHQGLLDMYTDESHGGAGADLGTSHVNPPKDHSYGDEDEDEDEKGVLDGGSEYVPVPEEDDDDKTVPDCCCKVTSAQIQIKNVATGDSKVAVSYITVKVKMTYKPSSEKATPDHCTLKWEERTTQGYFAPPRTAAGAVTAIPPKDEIAIPHGPEDPATGLNTLTPSWIDVTAFTRKAKTKKKSRTLDSWDEVMAQEGCPELKKWQVVDRGSAPSTEWPRDVQIKVTVNNGKKCAGSTVRKVIQHIDADGVVTSEPPANTPLKGKQEDPKGWSEPPTGGSAGGGTGSGGGKTK